MNKNFMFYRCFLEREMAAEGEPGLLAATEVVQAVCDAGFQRNGLKMKCYPSSPHCYYKYAKTPREGMYMMRAVRKTDMMTLDILIDTRLFPSFVMIENHKDWQNEADEVRDTLEKVINDDAEKCNWHINLREYNTSTTQNLEEFKNVLFKYLPEGPRYYDEDTVTDQTMREIAGELIREQALRKLNDEVPHGIAVLIDEMKQRKDGLWNIKATIVCEREAHKGIIIGKGGSMLKRIGTGSRIQIEKMTGDRVNLQLFVKVRKDWRDSDLYLKNYGYKDET